MEQPVIHLNAVRKSYGSVEAVRGLTLNVPPESIYGFLGPNGVGKTTTIRLILGLQKPDSGSIDLFGQPITAGRISVLGRIGSLVDTPSLYSHLTGRENLEVHRRLLALKSSWIDEALETVGLLSVGGRLVRNYSHGMRQRLGLAVALLGQPELLVLDEPTNGLDPAGIHEVRTLIQDLPRSRGVTVFLSSHLLSEVEQVATHLAILSDGQLKFEGTREDLRMRTHPMIVVEVDHPESACGLLESAGLLVRREGQRLVIQPSPDFGPGQINTMLMAGRVLVTHLSMERTTLEDVFLELTHGLGEAREVFQ